MYTYIHYAYIHYTYICIYIYIYIYVYIYLRTYDKSKIKHQFSQYIVGHGGMETFCPLEHILV